MGITRQASLGRRREAARARMVAADVRKISRQWRSFRRRLAEAAAAGRDLAPVFASSLGVVQPLLRDAMTVAYLSGYTDVVTDAKGHAETGAVALSIHQAAIGALVKRAGLGALQRAVLRREIGTLATQAMDGVQASLAGRIDAALAVIVAQDLTRRDALPRLDKAIRRAGIGPEKTYQLEAVYRTNVNMAYSAGQQEAAQSPVLQAMIWGWVYHTVGDNRVRASHAALDGTKLPADDPRWGTITPPNGWNCRCHVEALFRDQKPRVKEPREGGGADPGFQFNPGTSFQRVGEAVQG